MNLHEMIVEEKDKSFKQGLKIGLEALVMSLKPFYKNFEELYKAVIKNEVYKDITIDVKKYY